MTTNFRYFMGKNLKAGGIFEAKPGMVNLEIFSLIPTVVQFVRSLNIERKKEKGKK